MIRFVYEKRPNLAAQNTEAAATVEGAGPTTAQAAIQAGKKEQPAVAAETSQKPSVSESESVKERILALVVEKTGYPKDMLDLDLDLEADLGVDTVKQAEMFAAIREI